MLGAPDANYCLLTAGYELLIQLADSLTPCRYVLVVGACHDSYVSIARRAERHSWHHEDPVLVQQSSRKRL